MAVPMKIAGVQMDVVLGDPDRNMENMLRRLEESVGQGAALTVFPGCALTGYCFDTFEEAWQYAEPVPGPSSDMMAQACERLGCHAVYGMLEADGNRMFNTCVLVGPRGEVASYRKVHLPHLGVDRFTTPGDRPFKVVSVGETRIGMNICYDGSFPEAARIMALQGADVIVLPTNWPPGSECTAEYVPNARALENNVYYVSVNRVGTERGFRFIGHSKICDTDGSVLDEAPHDAETIMYSEIDCERARRKHLVRVPGKHEIHRLADRRPELYSPITDPELVPER